MDLDELMNESQKQQSAISGERISVDAIISGDTALLPWQTPRVRTLSVSLDTQSGGGSASDGIAAPSAWT